MGMTPIECIVVQIKQSAKSSTDRMSSAIYTALKWRWLIRPGICRISGPAFCLQEINTYTRSYSLAASIAHFPVKVFAPCTFVTQSDGTKSQLGEVLET